MLVPVCLDILNALYNRTMLDGRLNIVETGTTYLTTLHGHEKDLREERSTIAIANWRAGRNVPGQFLSIDIDGKHQFDCFSALEEFDLETWVRFRTGNGADVLSTIDFPVHFCLLDADSDAEVILREFETVAPKMSSNGVIVIDDAFKPYAVNKARRVLQVHAMRHSYPFREQAVAFPCGDAADEMLRSLSRV